MTLDLDELQRLCDAATPGKRVLDLTGERFGMLTVRRFAGRRSGKARWLCLCDCGQHKIVAVDSLRGGKTVSCGCFRRAALADGRKRLHAKQTTHGLSRTPEYDIWRGMLRRCTKADDPAYRNYGGRGIKVCERWSCSFEAFIADMGARPNAALSIDRINNNGNYEPGNCRWATAQEQATNTRVYGGGLSHLDKNALIEEVRRLREAVSRRVCVHCGALFATDDDIARNMHWHDCERHPARLALDRIRAENEALKAEAKSWGGELENYRAICARIGRDSVTDRAMDDIDAAVCALDDASIAPGDIDHRVRAVLAQNAALKAEVARLVLATGGAE